MLIPNTPTGKPPRPNALHPHNPSSHTSKTSFSSDSSQFSFNKGLAQTSNENGNGNGKISIRDDLFKLPKEDIIEILLEEIEEGKMLRMKLDGISQKDQGKQRERLKQRQRDREKYNKSNFEFFPEDGSWSSRLSQNQTGEFVSVGKYKELAEYMEEYIANTNQAHNHFVNIINQLKESNKKIKQENLRLEKNVQELEKRLQNQCTAQEYQIKIEQLENIVHNLQDSVAQYMNINNQSTRKYQKMKKMYQTLQQQLKSNSQMPRKPSQPLLDSKKQNLAPSLSPSGQFPSSPSCSSLSPSLQSALQRLQLLQIHNSQLKQSYSAMQKVLQIKSQKIRKLLQQMEKLSEQKWMYKEKYMELKSKSILNTQSSSKNYEDQDGEDAKGIDKGEIGEFFGR